MLYDRNASAFLLGILCNDTQLCIDDNYPLYKTDFYDGELQEGVKLHRVIYTALYNLASNGSKEVTSVDISEYLKNFKSYYECFNDNDGLNFVEKIKSLSNGENIDYYYNVVRKFAILRAYSKSGIDVSEIYDQENNDREKFNAMSLEEIALHYESKLAIIAKQFNATKRLDEYRAGANFSENKEKFKESPLIGSSFQSPYLNAIFRGMYGFILRSGNSGTGKSVLAIGDLCKMCVTEYWDSTSNMWIKNKSRIGNGLFINTEMDIEKELEPIFIAWIANVDRSHIIDGRYDYGEEERVDKAGQILYQSGIFLVDDPDFTIKSLTATIADYALNKNVKSCVFDYISCQPFLQAEIANSTKVPQREDMILLALTDRLKQVSRKFNVNILSGTQLNARENEIKYVNESLLMGGKGQVRKVDGCAIMLPPTPIELESVQYFNSSGFDPNVVLHIVKGRANKYGKYIKVFQYIDLSTGRTTDICVTDRENSPIAVDALYIEQND